METRTKGDVQMERKTEETGQRGVERDNGRRDTEEAEGERYDMNDAETRRDIGRRDEWNSDVETETGGTGVLIVLRKTEFNSLTVVWQAAMRLHRFRCLLP
ncbi:unnamed protein product [Lampetra fluviatilis]